MATLLFVYTRTSIRAAKRNAQLHREADGGQINWHNETLRRHGKLEPPEEQDDLKQLVGIARQAGDMGKEGTAKGGVVGNKEVEERVRERIKKGKDF